MSARKSFLLRMDPALYAQLERWASDEFRSVNGQVEFILRDALRKRGGAQGDTESAATAASGEPAAGSADETRQNDDAL
ncbi:MAG: ribbon-helix-helix domain-containing protein [Steroidobacteraceae bacterium]